mgnify:CR=1 FL=1
MQYKSVKGFTGAAQLGILLVFMGLGLILASGVQFIIGMQLVPAGTPMDKMPVLMQKALFDPQNVGYARLAQVLGTLFTFFIPAVLFSWVCNSRSSFWLGFNRYLNFQQILIGFGFIFFANIIAAPLEEMTKAVIAHLPSIDKIAKELEKAYTDQVAVLSNLKSWPEFIIALFIMAFFPALFEEVMFRGTLQNLLVRWWKSPLLGIVAASLIFSFIHMSVYLFASRAILGFVLGLLYHKTKNIWVNVIAHFLNNAFALIQLFILSNQKPQAVLSKEDLSKQDLSLPWWISILGVVILVLLFRALNKYSIANREKIDAQEQLLLAKENVYHPFANTENN